MTRFSRTIFAGFVCVTLMRCSTSATGAGDVAEVGIETDVFVDGVVSDRSSPGEASVDATIDAVDAFAVPTDAIEENLLPQAKIARLDVLRAAFGSGTADTIEAMILVPRRPDGSGIQRYRSGTCIVENIVSPAFEQFSEQLFFTAGGVEREVLPSAMFGTMRWSERMRPLSGVDVVTFRALDAELVEPWVFTAAIPSPSVEFTAPVGVNQLPMENLYLTLQDTTEVRWVVRGAIPQVRVQFETFITAPPAPYARSVLSCVYDGSRGEASIRLADHPLWIPPPNRSSGILFSIDLLERHQVPMGRQLVEVNMMHRQAVFPVTLRP